MSEISTNPLPTTTTPNQGSKLLNYEENEAIFQAMGPNTQSQATAVVEVFVTVPPHHNVWTKFLCGVATFTRDSSRKSFYIQIYEATQYTLVLEQEIYREFTYHQSHDYFHQYEGDERTIGLNFSDNEEASEFAKAVNKLLRNRKKQRDEKRKKAMAQKESEKKQKRLQQQQQMQQNQQPQYEQKREQPEKYKTIRGVKNFRKEIKKFATVGREKKPRKALEIGDPQDFRHVSHAGLDRQFGIDEEVLKLLENMGFDNKPENQKYAYEFIEKNVGGNMEEVKRMNHKLSTRRDLDGPRQRGPPPPVPTRAPSEISHSVPTPSPEKKRTSDSNNSSLASGGRPLPPIPGAAQRPPRNPPTRSAPPPPPQMPSNMGAPRPPPPMPTRGFAPQPPPLPSSSAVPRPPPPMPESGGGSNNTPDPRSALMEQIRSGPGGLKHVTANSPARDVPKVPKDGRSELMERIRAGDFNLNPVKREERKDSISTDGPPGLEGWALDLHRELKKREQFIQSEDTDSDHDYDDDDYDDEWD
ncbi:hypothetical protein SK128_012808 [Halocaridina rubra]|uniref:Neural Wiskott-Aldrich syndrome protein n=1 Tax=Halocaridina rubra TaxID=373956 RepID=A0AAN8XPX7_HALRR